MASTSILTTTSGEDRCKSLLLLRGELGAICICTGKALLCLCNSMLHRCVIREVTALHKGTVALGPPDTMQPACMSACMPPEARFSLPL